MKANILLLISIPLIAILSACNPKEQTADTPATPATTAAPAVSVEQAIPATRQLKQQPATVLPAKAIKSEPVNTEVAATANEPAKPLPTKDAIEEVNSYAREKTGTQTSRVRSKREAAEAELMQDVSK